MIVEIADLEIQLGQEQDFEVALEQAKQVLTQAKGFLGIAVHRGIELPNHYLLVLNWETLEDHTIGFRESELFVQWRTLIGPFFANPPQVLHWQPKA